MPAESPYENLKKIVYVGMSMYPLLRNLDVLYYDNNQSLSLGDIVIYKSNIFGRESKITHRIISISDRCIVTKGDNNLKIDDKPVNRSDILGIVVYAKRGSRLIRVQNGTKGLIISKIVHNILIIKTVAVNSIGHPYNWISRMGILKKFWPIHAKQKVINLRRPGGLESHLMVGKYLVAKKIPGNKNWIILPPFKLFIDEASLPNNDISTYEPPINNDNFSL
jgi:signal peptidase I